MKHKPMQHQLTELERLDGELWLCKRLGDHGASVHEGLTTTESRREQIRQIILRERFESVLVGRGKDRKPMTYAEAFERLYGEPLITREMRAKAAALRKQRA